MELQGEQRATEKSTHEASKNSIKQRQPEKKATSEITNTMKLESHW